MNKKRLILFLTTIFTVLIIFSFAQEKKKILLSDTHKVYVIPGENIFHFKSCKKIKNRYTMMTVSYALEKGYEPCHICIPTKSLKEKKTEEKEQHIENKIDNYDYLCEKINWRFNVPSGWNIKNTEEITKRIKKFREEVEENEGIPVAREIPLLYIYQGKKNRFNSNIMRCDMSKDKFIEMVERNYTDWSDFWKSNIKGCEMKSKRLQIIIDGVTFESFYIEMINRQRQEIIARWQLYDALINGWFFYMNYICSDYDAWKSIVSSIENSKFK